MPNVPTFRNRGEFTRFLRDQGFAEGDIAKIEVWLDRGDTALIYQNEDLGHPELGALQIVSYGSDEAQLPAASFLQPPQSLPDIGPAINWRFCLSGGFTDVDQARARVQAWLDTYAREATGEGNRLASSYASAPLLATDLATLVAATRS